MYLCEQSYLGGANWRSTVQPFEIIEDFDALKGYNFL